MDLEDLGLIDELGQHIFCIVCQPRGSLIVKTALCGKRALSRGIPMLPPLPDGLCSACAELQPAPCPLCGRP